MTDADVLIVPDRSDLNVYKTASKDGGEVGCCGPKSSSDNTTSGCGNQKKREVVSADLKDIDLNEWAGKFFKFKFLYYDLTVLKLTIL